MCGHSIPFHALLLWGWAPGPTSRLAPDSAAEIANFTAERWSTSEWPFESLANRSDDLFGGTAARKGVDGACASRIFSAFA